MRKLILKYTRKILVFFFPELYKLKNPAFNFESIMSHASNVKRGKNVKIDQIFRLDDVIIGDGTYITLNSRISNTVIGKYSNIGPNIFCGWGLHPTNGIASSAVFYSTDLFYGYTFSKENKYEGRKPINIGNDVFIGANVTILDGVTISDGAVIGAGAVVSKDIPPYAIAVGCPIKVIKYRFTDAQIEALLRIKWWDFDDEEKINDVERMFFDVDEFIKKYDTQ